MFTYKEVKKLQNQLPNNQKFYIEGAELNEDTWERYNDERLSSNADNGVCLHIQDLKDLSRKSTVLIGESFECCGKAYIYGFSVGRIADAKNLLKLAVAFAAQSGYTCLGFIHQRDSVAVRAGEHLDFKLACSFKNKRSGNQLRELYKKV